MKYFKWAYKACSFLGLVPLFNFDKKQICNKKQKCLIPVFFVFYITLLLGLFLIMIPDLIKDPVQLIRFLEIANIVAFLQMPIVSTIIMHFNIERWERYLKKFLQISTELHSGENTIERKTTLLLIIVFNTVQTIYTIGQIIQEIFKDKNILFKLWYSVTLKGEMHWLYMGIICNISLILFKRMYSELKNKLEIIVDEANDTKFLYNENKIIEHIIIIKKWTMELFHLIKYFNFLFGWYFLSNLFYQLLYGIDLLELLLERPSEFKYLLFFTAGVRTCYICIQ